AGARDRSVPSLRAHLSSLAFPESAAAEPRLRAVSRDLSAATFGRNRTLSGHAEPDGGGARHQAGTGVGGRGGAPADGVAERQDRARPGIRGRAGAVPAPIRGGE